MLTAAPSPPIYRLPPDWTIEPRSTPLAEVVDPFHEFLGVAALQAKTAGKIGQGAESRPLRFAVLDTGCDLDHRDLSSQILDASDFSGSRYGADDRNDHGTWCCGAIAAAADDYGVRGIAYDAKLLVAKVLGDGGSGSDSMILRGMRWAYGKGADVFSLSLGGGRMSETLHAVFREISQQPGKFIFCAAGNDGGPVNYPAAWKEVVAVGAVDERGRLTPFTSRDKALDILAPGVEILSTISGGKHGTMTGTSMATPIAAAIGGLIYADAVNSGKAGELSGVDMMIGLLRQTGRCDGAEGGDLCKYPLINPKALADVFKPDEPGAGPDPGEPIDGPPVEGLIVYADGEAWRPTGWEKV